MLHVAGRADGWSLMFVQRLDQFNSCFAKLALVLIRRHCMYLLYGLKHAVQTLSESLHLLFAQFHLFDRHPIILY